MSELSWDTRLHHIRWTRLVLLAEKWFSFLLIAFFFLLESSSLTLAALVSVLFCLYFFAHNHYHTLEDAGGLPANHLIVRY